MVHQYTIKKVIAKPFDGSDGAKVNYFWIKAEREDGVTVDIGTTMDLQSREGETLKLDVEKSERSGGRYGYKLLAIL